MISEADRTYPRKENKDNQDNQDNSDNSDNSYSYMYDFEKKITYMEENINFTFKYFDWRLRNINRAFSK